ncbi:hypothetical protein Ddc_12818 [Ditylenchus destructor]|nr:hypothetical protein Ddc_12818 [Ditylenchus destructor]
MILGGDIKMGLPLGARAVCCGLKDPQATADFQQPGRVSSRKGLSSEQLLMPLLPIAHLWRGVWSKFPYTKGNNGPPQQIQAAGVRRLLWLVWAVIESMVYTGELKEENAYRNG